MALLNFVSVLNGVLLIAFGIAFYIFSAHTISLGIYIIGAILAFWAFIKTRSINVKLPSIDNDSARLKSHYTQKNSVKDKLEEVLEAFSMAVVWPAYGVLMFIVGIASAAILPTDDKKRSRETSPLDFGMIVDFIMPTQLLVQVSILLFSVWLSVEWAQLLGAPLQITLVSILSLGLLAQYLGFLLKPNLPENFSKSALPPWVYISMSFSSVLICGIFARENIFALADGASRPFASFDLFSIFQDWTVNGQFPFSSIWAQSSSFSDLAANIAQEASSLGVVKWFDLLFMAGLSGVFIRNGLASLRYALTDEDHAVRAARLLKVGRIEKAVVEGGLVVDRQTYLADLAHVYLAAQQYQKFLELCREQIERGSLLHLDFSEAGRAQALITGYLISYEVPLSRGYEIFSQIVKEFGDLAASLYFWRDYSAAQKLSLGEIFSLYPDDDGILELFEYIKTVDKYLLLGDDFFSEIEGKFGTLNPSIYLTTSILLAAVGSEAKTDRRAELAGQSIQRLLCHCVGEISSGYQVRSVEPLATSAVLELRLPLSKVLAVPDNAIVDVVNATIAGLPKHSKMADFLRKQLKVSVPS